MQRNGQAEGIPRLYYSIREVSEMTDLKPHVLRYWETEFRQLAPRKNAAGRRVYTEKDIEVVRRIQTLLKDDKYTIEGARQVLKRKPATEQAADITDELVELRAFLANLLQKL